MVEIESEAALANLEEVRQSSEMKFSWKEWITKDVRLMPFARKWCGFDRLDSVL